MKKGIPCPNQNPSLHREEVHTANSQWPFLQIRTYSTNFSNYTAWKWQLEKKNHDLAPELTAYILTRSFSYASHQCGRDSLTPNCHIYTVAGGSQYYGHLRPTPEGSVRWYARRASSMCMCMSPRARWKMVHRSYLYLLSVSVMQAGVTCTSFSNYTAWKWQLEKKCCAPNWITAD